MNMRSANLPFLPGYTFNSNIGRTKFNLNSNFEVIGNGNRVLKEKVKPNMLGVLSDRYPSTFPRGEVKELPSWIAYDKHILRFEGFYRQTLQEVNHLPFLHHKVFIYFYLEDGTIQVVEPKLPNSGAPQGTLIKRHRIRFPAPMDENFYEIMDLNVGKEVEFYGKVFKITDCDLFTRNFLNRCGITVPDPIVSS